MEPIILSIEQAIYQPEYKIELHFSDGIKRIVDFEPFLKSKQNPMVTKFLELNEFKKFVLKDGDLMWGGF